MNTQIWVFCTKMLTFNYLANFINHKIEFLIFKILQIQIFP
jgi:hypothetical protein